MKKTTDPVTSSISRAFEYLQTLGYKYVNREIEVRSGARVLQADAVVYDNAAYATPLIVVEHKESFSERPNLLDRSVQQAFTLSTLLGPSVRYLLITDGDNHAWFERNPTSQSLVPLEAAPTVSQEEADSEHAEAGGRAPVISRGQLVHLIQELIDLLRRESLVFGVRMAVEVNRILIAKLQDERTITAGHQRARFRRQGTPTETSYRLRQLYQEATSTWKHTSRDFWTASSETLAQAVGILEPYHLSSAPHDVFGGLFWEIFPSLLPRDQAQHFTPASVARLLVELANPSVQDRVIDPGCGSGLLLLEASRHMRSRNVVRSESGELPSTLIGIDLNAEVTELAATNLLLAGLNPDQILHADALSSDSLERVGVRLGTFDVVLLDLPVGRPTVGSSAYHHLKLARRSSSGLETLFLEQALNLLRLNGRLAVLVPDSLLSSPGQLATRRWLLSNAVPRAIISLPPEAFAPVGHSGKASILILEKTDSASKPADLPVFIADVTAVGYDRFGKAVPRNDLPTVVHQYSQFLRTSKVAIEESDTGPHAWTVPFEALRPERLDVLGLDPRVRDITYRLRHSDYPTATLKEVAEVLSGRNFKRYVDPSYANPIVIQAGAVREFLIDTSLAPSISLEEYWKSRRSHVQQGDVLVTTTGQYLGRAAVVQDLRQLAVASGAVTILRPIANLDPYFLAAFLNSKPGRQQVASRQAAATAQPYIRRSDLAEILVSVPSIEIQRDLGQRARAMHVEALELRRRAEEIEDKARDIVATNLLGGSYEE